MAASLKTTFHRLLSFGEINMNNLLLVSKNTIIFTNKENNAHKRIDLLLNAYIQLEGNNFLTNTKNNYLL